MWELPALLDSMPPWVPSIKKDSDRLSWTRPLLLIILGWRMHGCYSSLSWPIPARLVYLGGRREWRPLTAKQSPASGDLHPPPPVPGKIFELESSPLVPFSSCLRECKRVRAPWANAPPNHVAGNLQERERARRQQNVVLGADFGGT